MEAPAASMEAHPVPLRRHTASATLRTEHAGYGARTVRSTQGTGRVVRQGHRMDPPTHVRPIVLAACYNGYLQRHRLPRRKLLCRQMQRYNR